MLASWLLWSVLQLHEMETTKAVIVAHGGRRDDAGERGKSASHPVHLQSGKLNYSIGIVVVVVNGFVAICDNELTGNCANDAH